MGFCGEDRDTRPDFGTGSSKQTGLAKDRPESELRYVMKSYRRFPAALMQPLLAVVVVLASAVANPLRPRRSPTATGRPAACGHRPTGC